MRQCTARSSQLNLGSATRRPVSWEVSGEVKRPLGWTADTGIGAWVAAAREAATLFTIGERV